MSGTVTVTKHASRRYIERVKPHLTIKQARKEIIALAEMAETCSINNVLTSGQPDRGQGLVLADGIYAPIKNCPDGAYIVTVLTRSGMSEMARQKINKTKASRRRKRSRSRRPEKTPYLRQREWALDD